MERFIQFSTNILQSSSRAFTLQKFEGIENIDKIVDVDQTPIGRTPRSNPATYTGMFTDIRNLLQNCQNLKSVVTKREDFLST